MFQAGIEALMSYLWRYNGRSSKGDPKKTMITDDRNGLQVKMCKNEGPDSSDWSNYVLTLTPDMRQGLLEYIAQKKKCSYQQARSFLHSCIRDSLSRHVYRPFSTGMLIAPLPLVCLLLETWLKNTVWQIGTPGVIAIILLATLWIITVLSKGLRCRSAINKLQMAPAAEMPAILDKVMPYASRSMFASVNIVLGLILTLGCVGCLALEILLYFGG